MPKLNTTVTKQPEGLDLAAINAAAAKELSGDPTVNPKSNPELQALFEASQAAAKANEENTKARAEQKAQLRSTDINQDARKASVGESVSLIAAVKADAEKRGKNFSICPISGVLVVG
jgi:hypothetical protein